MDDLQTLLRPLIEEPEAAPQPVEWIAGQARRRTHRRRGLQVATAAMVLAVPTWLVARSEPDVDARTGPADTASTTTTTSTTSGPPTTAAAAEDGSALGLGATVPWAGPPLAAADAPAYVQAAANSPGAAAKCPVVAPDDVGEGAAATAQPTPPDDLQWGVLYELPPTTERGRTTFAVSAVALPAGRQGRNEVPALVTERAATHTWSDGSIAGWGDLPDDPRPPSTVVVDGQVVDMDEVSPDLPDEPISMRGGTAVSEPPSMVIQFQLQGADPACLYTVDSGLSRDHAFHLLQHLRRVEGT